MALSYPAEIYPLFKKTPYVRKSGAPRTIFAREWGVSLGGRTGRSAVANIFAGLQVGINPDHPAPAAVAAPKPSLTRLTAVIILPLKMNS
jgi:hypothetical protein